MDWILEDWEYPNDHIYAMERHHDMQVEWQQWEEEQENKKRLPAIIKVEIPILTDEAERNTRTVRGAHQTRL
jgi:ribosomal protein L5